MSGVTLRKLCLLGAINRRRDQKNINDILIRYDGLWAKYVRWNGMAWSSLGGYFRRVDPGSWSNEQDPGQVCPVERDGLMSTFGVVGGKYVRWNVMDLRSATLSGPGVGRLANVCPGQRYGQARVENGFAGRKLMRAAGIHRSIPPTDPTGPVRFMDISVIICCLLNTRNLAPAACGGAQVCPV